MTVDSSAQDVLSSSALELNLRALRPILAGPEVTELCINRPGEAFVETRTGWERRALPFASFDWCRRLAKLIANSTRQRVDEATPLLSASLPTGERAQIVLPPATTAGTVAITLRRPSDEVWSIGELAGRGIFRSTRRSSASLDATEQELLGLLAAQQYEAFMRLAVVSRKNILVSGPTGSGKNHLDESAHSGDPFRRAPGHDRGRSGAGSRHPSESRPALLFQGRPGARPRDTEAAPGIVSAHEAGPDPARRAARGGGL